MKLEESFYQRGEVTQIARDLLGKILVTNLSGQITRGRIVETEAYSWVEKGCHAYGGRKTARNAIMFEPGGHAYIYLCYGIHHLFNVVTNVVGVADAVLIRALEPLGGLPVMEARRSLPSGSIHLTSGPGKLTQALGITRAQNGCFLTGSVIWIEDSAERVHPSFFQTSKRIGIDYAGKDAELPWRFFLKENKWVSKTPSAFR